jgi:hypothetical protein
VGLGGGAAAGMVWGLGFSLLGILRVGEGIWVGFFSFMKDGWARSLGS